MNSRERVQRAISFEKPDRVPWFGIGPGSDLFPMIQLTPRSWQPREPYLPYVNPLELTFRTWRSKRKLPRGWIHAKHQAIDEWGIVWERFGTFTSQGQVIEPALKTWDDLPALTIPDPREPARYTLFTKLAKLLGRKRFKYASLGNHFLFEMFHFLRGWEHSMRDIVRPPKQASELLDRLCEYYIAIADEWIQRGVDALHLVDDLGGQNEPLLSPRAFKALFLPRYKRVIDYCHDHGKPVLLHSCGDIKEIMPLLVDAGFDVFQFDSPDMTGIEWCAEHFGGKVAFMDVVDIQNVIPAGKGTHDDIVRYTKRLIYNLGRFDGGLVLSQYPTPADLKPQKGAFTIARKACKRHGKYPLDEATLLDDKALQ